MIATMSASTSTRNAIASSAAISSCGPAPGWGKMPKNGRTSGSVTPYSAAITPLAEFALPSFMMKRISRSTSKMPKMR
jgi:hypothetical protein